MNNIKNITVNENSTIMNVLKIIDKNAKQLALVVDKNKKLLGTITDGDIRRAILKDTPLSSSIKTIYNKNPTIANINASKEEILYICTIKKLHQIPIVDDFGNLIRLETLDKLIEKRKKKNKIILMVGGLGTRLRPLTENIPKPMLKVGGKPILQIIVEKLASYGFENIIMCVNYKSKVIKNYFKNGAEFNVSIKYINETKRMGTAGALSLIKENIDDDFIVMNGDLLTNINFEYLLDYHKNNNSDATMCVREYNFQIPYGVVELKNNKILSIQEKPEKNFFVSAGIYVLSSKIIQNIPNNQYYDMPTLFDQLIKKDFNILSFPIRDYWLDIGRIEEYKKANDEYEKVF